MAAAAAAPPLPLISCDARSLELGGVLTSAPGLLTFTLTSRSSERLRVRLSSTLGDVLAFQVGHMAASGRARTDWGLPGLATHSGSPMP